jgi:hypothetical protein
MAFHLCEGRPEPIPLQALRLMPLDSLLPMEVLGTW